MEFNLFQIPKTKQAKCISAQNLILKPLKKNNYGNCINKVIALLMTFKVPTDFKFIKVSSHSRVLQNC